MNTFQLKCFLAVAETLNFAKAARTLNTTQPTITHQIKSLEEELNTKLFNRSTRVVELTADGLSFMDDARSMISIEEQARLRFSIPSDKNVESITIGCTSNLQVTLMERVLSKLNLSIKNFHPIFVVNARNHLLHLMETDQIDVMFDLTESENPPEKCKFVELAKSKIVGYCRKESRFNSIEKLSLSEKIEFPVIISNSTQNIPNISKFQLLLVENLDIANVHFSQSAEISMTLAKAGIGMAILPSIYIQTDDQSMQQLAIEGSPAYKFGLYHKSPLQKPLTKTFIDAIKTDFLL